MTDLAERLEALASRNENPPVPDDEESLMRAFCDLLREGFTPPQAAERLGKSGSWFRRRRNPQGTNYNEGFAREFEEIMAPDGEHREALVDSARDALLEAAKGGNVRAIEKILMAYDPDFQFLRPPQFAGDVNIDKLMIVMKDLPTEILQQAKEAILARQRELPAIDA